MSINKCFISGNLTRDPELRMTKSSSQVLTFCVAVNDRRRNPQTDEWEDVPNFIDCVVFGNRAEPLSRFLSKGMKVAVEGKLRWSQWEKDGQKRSKIEVIVEECEFLTNSKAQKQAQQPQTNNYPPQQGYVPNSGAQVPQNGYYQSPQPPVQDVYDEDIPF